MSAIHLELLVEEPSMEAFLRALLPRLLPRNRTFQVHPFQGKRDLLGKLEARLRGYASWLPPDWRIVVVVDRDNEDCRPLKERVEDVARRAGLRTRSSAADARWQLVSRLAIEELEAWYFGDWSAVQAAYPRVSADIAHRKGLRDPDAIQGGTWETFERIMQGYGYFRAGLAKVEAARAIGAKVDPSRSRSHSLTMLCRAIGEALA